MYMYIYIYIYIYISLSENPKVYGFVNGLNKDLRHFNVFIKELGLINLLNLW